MATTPTTRVTQLARTHRLDIDTATFPASEYQQLFGLEDLKLIEERRVEEDEMYEDAGAMREAVIGYNWRIELKMARSTNLAGDTVDAVQAFLRTRFKATRSTSAQAEEFGIRFYDRNGLDSGHNHEGLGRCRVARAATASTSCCRARARWRTSRTRRPT